MKKYLLATALLALMTSEGMAGVNEDTGNTRESFQTVEIQSVRNVKLQLQRKGTLTLVAPKTIDFMNNNGTESMKLTVSGNMPKENVSLSFVSTNGGLKYNTTVVPYTVVHAEGQTTTHIKSGENKLDTQTLTTLKSKVTKSTDFSKDFNLSIILDKALEEIKEGDYSDILRITVQGS